MSAIIRPVSPARTIILAVCLMYIFAFGSYYYQFPGLYGPNGILPANWEIDSDDIFSMLSRWIAGGVQRHNLLEATSLAGLVVAVLSVAFRPVRGGTSLLILYVCYLLCVKHGGVFMHFQWDSLLLESGFLTMLLAWQSFDSDVIIFLFRWLTFRLMFSSGAVKLLSGCPLWWSLKATSVHYQSQCLPTVAAYFVHHLPMTIHRLSDALTFIAMLGFSWPAILPFRRLSNVAFAVNVLVQLAIFATGNYNFMNLLTICLCYSLLRTCQKDRRDVSSLSSFIWNGVCTILSYMLVPIGFTVFALYRYFGLRVDEAERQVSVEIGFSPDQFSQFVDVSTLVAVSIATITLAVKIFQSFIRSISDARGKFSAATSFYRSLTTSALVLTLYVGSVVSFSGLSPALSSKLPQQALNLNRRLSKLHIANGYGLFARMTGADGRPELILEGTRDNVTWNEYEFFYKPGNVSLNPTQAAPYQPRLDWQMWFAALAESETQGWYLNFVYRLLNGSTDVLALLKYDPFSGRRPMTIRTQLYNYQYTSRSANEWWTRVLSHLWHLPVSLASPVFDDLKRLDQETQPDTKTPMTAYLNFLRGSISPFNGFQFCVGLGLIALVTGKVYDTMFPSKPLTKKEKF